MFAGEQLRYATYDGQLTELDSTDSADLISMLMFEPHYLEMLIGLGAHDVAQRVNDLRVIIGRPAISAV